MRDSKSRSVSGDPSDATASLAKLAVKVVGDVECVERDRKEGKLHLLLDKMIPMNSNNNSL